MVSQHCINMYPNITAIFNMAINLLTNLSNICTAPLLILTIITLPTKYGNNPLTNIRFNLPANLPTNLPTILLPTYLPLTSQWDNLAMSITLTNLQFGTTPLTDLQVNLPTILPTLFPHTHHYM